MSGQVEDFGTMPDGRGVQRIRLANGSLTAHFLTFGAVLQDLRLTGHAPPLVLGLNSLADYLAHSRSFGITAGRCANRIGRARYTLDGTEVLLTPNPGSLHALHGGPDGTGRRVWTVADIAADRLRLTETLPDGHMGYPGTVRIEAEFRLDGAALDIRYRAVTDAPTLVNLAHHTYWVLDGSGTVLDHVLQIDGDRITEVDADLIPTGGTPPVAGTSFDFRKGKRLGDAIAIRTIDHNYCLGDARVAIRPVMRLESLASGVTMRVVTTEPGLQIYDAASVQIPVPGLDGARYGAHCGLAVEPQVWPDAVNHAGFPSPVLRPGETYEQHTRFEFERG